MVNMGKRDEAREKSSYEVPKAPNNPIFRKSRGRTERETGAPTGSFFRKIANAFGFRENILECGGNKGRGINDKLIETQEPK